MASPEAAVEEFLDAARGSDPLGLLAVLHPAERALVQTLYQSTTGAAESAGGIDIDAALQALHVDIRSSRLDTEYLADDLAWVTTDRADVAVDLDDAALDDATVLDIGDIDLSGEDDEYDSTGVGDGYAGSFSPSENHVGIAVVELDGSWFVSAAYTVAELARVSMDLPPRYSPGPAAPTATTPAEAVGDLLAAIANKDQRAVASTLVPYEGGLVADYESTIGGELLRALSGYSVELTAANSTVVEQDDARAVVEVDRWTFGVSGTSDDGYDQVDVRLDVNGLCGSATVYDEYDGTEQSSGCAFNEPEGIIDLGSVLADDGWRGPRLVVEKQGDAWAVSLLQTVLYPIGALTDDPVTIAAIGESFFWREESYYIAAFQLLANDDEPLPVGVSTVETVGHGRSAHFRVAGPANLTIDGPAECVVYVVERSGQDWDLWGEYCGGTIFVGGEEAIVFVGMYSSPFTGIAPLGRVSVSVNSA